MTEGTRRWSSSALLPFALATFIAAFLLFQAQPLIAKLILPWFGGAAAVWTTCMLFFQLLLLAGYAYVHFVIRRLRPRAQVLVHVALLLAAASQLPIVPDDAWKPLSGILRSGIFWCYSRRVSRCLTWPSRPRRR